MKILKKKSILVAVIILLTVTIATATALAASENQPEITTDGRSLSTLQLHKDYGEMKQIDSNSDNGARKFADDRYVYWFDANDRLISRVLVDVSNETERIELTRDEALRLTAEEVALYIDGFEITEKIEVNISNNDSGTPWEVNFVTRNEDNVAYRTYSATIDIYGDVCLMFISEQQPAKERVCINKTSAYNFAINAIASNLSSVYQKSIMAEDLLNTNSIVIAKQDLYAYEGRSIWSFELSNFIIDGKLFEHSFFVRVDAVSGEVLYLSTCR
jgi:hypothetical protein